MTWAPSPRELRGLPKESWASTPAVRAVMKGNATSTKPERALRSRLHQRGLRFRVGTAPLPTFRRKADIVFPRQQLAVFVDGCYWHGCPDHGRVPSTNNGYWAAKLRRNAERDRDTDQVLADNGWTVIRVWEHEDFEAAAAAIDGAVQTIRDRTGRSKSSRSARTAQ